MESKVFDRIEKKYLITKAQKKAILSAIRKRMHRDNYHKSEVFNIYFDNQNYDSIINSIDWIDFKAKIRARSYKGYDRVFLEIKTKIRGEEENIGHKRRIMITRSDYDELINKNISLVKLAKRKIEKKNDLQIAKEIDYFIKRFNLSPKVLVSYKRESYINDEDLRITFDEDLRYRSEKLTFNRTKNDKMYFEDGQTVIMEIKAHGVLPLWLVGIMSEQKIYPQQFSKIGNIYQLIKKKGNHV